MENMLGRDAYVTIPEAAKKLNVSTVTVRKWVRNGDLVSTKVKNPRNKQEMSLIHKNELDFFKENVMPKIYHKDRVPRKIKKSRATKIWDKIKELLGFD